MSFSCGIYFFPLLFSLFKVIYKTYSHVLGLCRFQFIFFSTSNSSGHTVCLQLGATLYNHSSWTSSPPRSFIFTVSSHHDSSHHTDNHTFTLCLSRSWLQNITHHCQIFNFWARLAILADLLTSTILTLDICDIWTLPLSLPSLLPVYLPLFQHDLCRPTASMTDF